MTEKGYVLLEDRGVIALSGADTRDFLQGVISNDVDKLGPARALYAGLLTAQGKFLHDFFVIESADAILLDCARAGLDDLVRRLTLFRLRADVSIADRSADFVVAVMIGEDVARSVGLDGDTAGAAAPFGDGIALVDPRLAALGARAILGAETAARALEEAGLVAAERTDYERRRLTLGVPDGDRDIIAEKSFLLECNFGELNGVDFDKGCYVGQENTARQKHRGVVRKRLMRVDVDGPPPAAGTPIMLGDKVAGEMRSSLDGVGMALLRLEFVDRSARENAPLTAGEATLTPVKPDWAAY
jgi:folate-binding protein YgfZ